MPLILIEIDESKVSRPDAPAVRRLLMSLERDDGMQRRQLLGLLKNMCSTEHDNLRVLGNLNDIRAALVRLDGDNTTS